MSSQSKSNLGVTGDQTITSGNQLATAAQNLPPQPNPELKPKPSSSRNSVENHQNKSTGKKSNKSSRRSSKREFMNQQMIQLKKEQEELARLLVHSKEKIDQLAKLQDEASSSSSQCDSEPDSIEKTLDWFDNNSEHGNNNPNEMGPSLRVTFKAINTERDTPTKRMVTEDIFREAHNESSVKPDEMKSFKSFSQRAARASTPMPWLEAKNNDTFLSALNKSNVQREASLERQARKLTLEEIAARHGVPKHLPKFSGEPSEWPKFIHCFITSTKRCGFTNDENAERLRDALTGEALKLVDAKLIFPEKVNQALALLRLKFGRPDQILDAVTDKVENEPPVLPEDLDGLVRMGAVVDDMCTTLKAAKMEEHLQNPRLLRSLVKKLPADYRMQWGFQRKDGLTGDLEEFNRWLFSLAEIAAEMADNPKKPPKERPAPKTIFNFKKPETKRVYQTNIVESRPDSTFSTSKASSCLICKNSYHAIPECLNFLRMTGMERWKTVRDLKLCGKCLKEHNYKNCRKKTSCGVQQCPRRHHPLLHNGFEEIFKRKSNEPSSTSQPISEHLKPKNTEVTAPPAKSTLHHHSSQASKTLFRIMPVKIYNKNGKDLQIYALLDEGSSVTMIDQDVADQLELEGPIQELCLQWTSEVTRTEENSRKVDLRIAGQNEKKYCLSGVRTVKDLRLPTQSMTSFETSVFEELPVARYHEVTPKMLIGLPHWSLALPLDYCEDGRSHLTAIKSRLGWTIVGHNGPETVNKNGFETVSHIRVHECESVENVDEILLQLRQFFSLEYFGVRSSKPPESEEERRAREILHRTMKLENGRYEVGLLWRKDEISLPDSKNMAILRMKCLERKLVKNSELYDNLRNQIQEYLDKNYIELLSKEEAIEKTPKTWYLPIFPVVNPNKPGKVRIVWDAAAKINGVSLNSNLLTGPDLLIPLVDILRRFRQYKFALIADIEEMFHRVKIIKEDRNSQRFLWRDNVNEEIQVYRMKVMTFGSACSPTAAQFVKNENALQFEKEHPRAVNAILNNHYVDDYTDSFKELDEAVQTAKDVVRIHSNAGFKLRKFSSNCPSLLSQLGESQGSEVLNFSPSKDSLHTTKVLGLFWHTTQDTLNFEINLNKCDQQLINGERKPTKREILKFMMTIFDPLGLVTPILLQIKMIMQDVWRSGSDWDQPVSEQQNSQWLSWISNLRGLEISIPRCYDPELSTKEQPIVELHLFVDASECAFAAVAYFRICHTSGEVKCCLVGAKSKVAPLKPLSIPRLELQGAVLGVRLAESISEGHTITFTRRFFWTDSTNVLGWIHSEARRYKPFVSLRIGEILENSLPTEWRYVPTSINIADDATKIKTSTLRSDSPWFNGPEFLRESESSWPKNKVKVAAPTDEMKFVNVHSTEMIKRNATPNPFNISKYQILIRSQAWVFRTIRFKKKNIRYVKGEYSQLELDEAEKEVIRSVQAEAFGDEHKSLELDGRVDKTSSIYSLTPILDEDNIIRMRGRLQRSNRLPTDLKHPIILPQHHRVTHLLIDKYHRALHHQNNETVVNEIRQRFWIPKVRIAVRQVAKKCQACKVRKAKPHPPIMADLPVDRITPGTAFAYVGLDYFGPMEIVEGRKKLKRWGAVFTCLVIRAVHIELVSSLSSNSAIMCIRRFISKRGMPIRLWSDNATCFRGANDELSLVTTIDFRETAKLLDAEVDKFDWCFIPPATPHMGGAWERLVRSVKSALSQVQTTRTPTEEQLETYLAEVANVINSRPLTYVPIEPGANEALTPNHFLLLSSNGSKRLGKIAADGLSLKKQWRETEIMVDKFWERFVVEVMPDLNRRSKWFEEVPPLTVGDVGIIWDENTRNSWKLGRIEGVIPSNDGQVRQIMVRTDTGLFKRAAAKFAKLDVVDSTVATNNQVGEFKTGDELTKGGMLPQTISNDKTTKISELPK